MQLGIMKKMIFIYINPPEKERALLQLKSRWSRPLYSTITGEDRSKCFLHELRLNVITFNFLAVGMHCDGASTMCLDKACFTAMNYGHVSLN